MILYKYMVAPNPVKVLLYLAEKEHMGVEMDLQLVDVSLGDGEHKSKEHLARNPLGTLPVLELDDGTCINESLAIINYLEDRYPTPSIYGSTLEEKAHARALERTTDHGAIVFLSDMVNAINSPVGHEADPAGAKFLAKRAALDLAYLEDLLSDGRPFLAGDRVTLADCTLAAGLQFARFRSVDLPGTYPHIERWDKAYKARPHVGQHIIF